MLSGVVYIIPPVEAVNHFRKTSMSANTAFSSAHRLYVKSLYRRYLTNSLDWTINKAAVARAGPSHPGRIREEPV